jgi:hypothetical protein
MVEDPANVACFLAAVGEATEVPAARRGAQPRPLSPEGSRASHRQIRAVGKGEFLVAWTEATREGPVRWSSARLNVP